VAEEAAESAWPGIDEPV
jgi:hypothetical protein